MGDLEFLLGLLVGAAVLVRLADVVHVPYPIVLVLGGLGAALLPGLPVIVLEPEVIFVVFLPPLIHAAGWQTSPQDLRAALRPLTALTLGLTLLTMAAVAVVAHATVEGMGWAAAFILGAVVAPTDPVAALATFTRVGVPERLRLLVEGESMLNDAVALVAYRLAVTAAVTGAFAAGWALVDFVVSAIGGAVVGLAVGWIAHRVVQRVGDPALTIFVTLLIAYSSYVLAEELGVSGVLGAVVSGLYLGWNQHAMFDADTRLSATAFWQVLVFALNAILFVLLGLQFPGIVDELREDVSLGALLGAAAAVAATVVGVRLLFLLLPGLGFGDSVRERLAIGWTGMRGAISLAAVLAVPLAVPERSELIFSR